MSIFGSGRLINSNATVDIELVTIQIDNSGGTKEVFSSVIGENVPVLITRIAGGRDGGFNTDAQRGSCTVTGVNDDLRAQTTRLKITAFPSRPDMVGYYLRVTSAIPHPIGQGGLLQPRISLQCQFFQLPAETFS